MPRIALNGNSSRIVSTWIIWAFGIMFTIGMASQAAQFVYVNVRFDSHEQRPHKDAVRRTELTTLSLNLEKLAQKVDALNDTSIEMKTILKRMEKDGR